MQKQVLELLLSKGFVFKKFTNLDMKKYTKKRTIQGFFGVDLEGYNTLVYMINSKSKILKKDAEYIFNLDVLIQKDLEKTVKKHILFYNSDICSKSIKLLKESSFKIYDFM